MAPKTAQKTPTTADKPPAGKAPAEKKEACNTAAPSSDTVRTNRYMGDIGAALVAVPAGFAGIQRHAPSSSTLRTSSPARSAGSSFSSAQVDDDNDVSSETLAGPSSPAPPSSPPRSASHRDFIKNMITGIS
ncbi:hypothetical protein H2203_009279 [Taxawa tesnikishii (nom. ined.)]|nr:hypothetical protein H2203_009279 [Dothideales sp. JES 119]